MEHFEEVTIDKIMWMIEKVDKEKEIVHPKGAVSTTVFELMSKFSSSEEFHVFIYKNDSGRTVGFTSTFPNNDEGRISIGVTYILPEYRGLGFGYNMRTCLVRWSQNNGFDSVYARTWSGNHTMVKLNEKMGFKEIGRDENVRENGDDTVKFLLKL